MLETNQLSLDHDNAQVSQVYSGQPELFRVVCFLWRQDNSLVQYSVAQVNTLYAMLSKHLYTPFKLYCITDTPVGINPEVEVILLWNFARTFSVSNWRINRPHTHRCLKIFSGEMYNLIGPRFIVMDLDCVITGSLDALFSIPDDFVILRGGTPRNCYNSSLYMMDAGSRKQVWQSFSLPEAEKASKLYLGGDQAFIRHVLGPDEKTVGSEHGVYQYSDCPAVRQNHILPDNCRLMFFAGSLKPWHATARARIPWVTRYYRL